MRLPNGHAISAVPIPMLSEAWPLVMRWIDDALEHAWGYNSSDVLQKLMEGTCMLWVIEKDYDLKGAVVTEVVCYPRCKTLHIWLTGGADFQEWKECIAELEMYAKYQNCQLIEAAGRPGLQRLLKDLGFNVPRVLAAKKVDYISH